MFEHGILIGEKHTYDDWDLVCTRIEISDPERKTYFVEIPGRDGVIDLSEAMVGDVKYGNRELRMEFIRRQDNRTRWHLRSSDILDYCHGQRRKLILDSDRSYYYEGRLRAETEKDFKGVDRFTISVTADPYKYERYSSLEPWVWDTFCFEDGIIRDYKDLKVNGTMTLLIPGRRKKVVPVIDCSVAMTLEYGGRTYYLPAGRSKIVDLQLGAGEHYLTFQGTGMVSVEYRGARL